MEKMTAQELYQFEMKAWLARVERTRPIQTTETDEEFETIFTRWSFELHMDKPNAPGYFRANND